MSVPSVVPSSTRVRAVVLAIKRRVTKASAEVMPGILNEKPALILLMEKDSPYSSRPDWCGDTCSFSHT